MQKDRSSTPAAHLRQQFPEPWLPVIAVVITLPMAAWMRLRGMEWRPLEMSAAGISAVIYICQIHGAGMSGSIVLH